MNFPTTKYNIIYADPAWSYKSNRKVYRNDRDANTRYQVSSHQELKDIPVQSIAAKDCLLFMWVTMPKLNTCWEIIEAWGFTYKTVAFTWVKTNKKSLSFFWGMGRWTRSNAELCLLATKGKPKRVSAAVHSVVAQPIEKHSKKPDIIREKIVLLCGDLPRIELFARQKTDGWDVWGKEV